MTSSATTLTWIGLKELRAALLRLPEELTELAVGIVNESADRAAAAVREAYPIGPGNDTYEGGNLKRGVGVKKIRTEGHRVVRVVRSSAPHAYIFEMGTTTRQTKLGYNRGFMPGSNIFVPIVVAARREMLEDLTAVVEDAGIDVRR